MKNSLVVLICLSVLLTSCRGKTEPPTPDQPSGQEPRPGEVIKASSQADELALQEASFSGAIEDVIQLLPGGVDPNAADSEGRTALMLASFNGHTDIVRILLDSGAETDQLDSLGRTALIYGSSGPFPQTIELLLERQANPNVADLDEHFTALMHAAAEGNIEVVKVLLAHGADPGMKDIDGDTAESFARQGGHQEVADLLKSK